MQNKNLLPVITLLLAIILSIGWYQFIYEPARREILSMELETRRLREIEREILELKIRHKNLSTFLEEKEFQLDEARTFLPSTLTQDKFITELYRTAEFCDVRVISIRMGEIISTEEFQSQVVNISLEADYISLLNFIREIIDGSRLVNIEKISVESSKSKILSCELSLKIFATNS